MTPICPCCGAPVECPAIVSLDTNTCSTAYGTAKLQPQIAVMVETLMRKYPGGVRTAELGLAMWGDGFWGIGESALGVALHKARVAIKPLGLEIITTTNAGYRLVKTTESDGDENTTS